MRCERWLSAILPSSAAPHCWYRSFSWDPFLPYIHLAQPLIATQLFRHLGFTNQIPLDGFLSGCLALALNEGAYMAEIARAGIDSIESGQMEAAKSLGMTYGLAMRRIVLPQALRVIVPPLNEFNSMLKSSSLVSVISVADLLEIAQTRASSLAAPLELLTVAAIWYLILTTISGLIQFAYSATVERVQSRPDVAHGSLVETDPCGFWSAEDARWRCPERITEVTSATAIVFRETEKFHKHRRGEDDYASKQWYGATGQQWERHH